MLGQPRQRSRVVGRGVCWYGGAALAGPRQVGNPYRGRAVFKRVAPEHAAPGVGVTEKEAALHLALRVVTEGVQPRLDGLKVETKVAEEFIVVLDLRRAPDLRRGPSYVLIARLDQSPRIVALHAAASLVGIHELEAEVGKSVLGQRQAQVGRHVHLVTVPMIVLTPACVYRQALRVFPEPEIQDAGDGVRAVLSRRAVTQYFHPLECNGRDHRNIGRMRPVRNTASQEGDHGGAVAAFAVDQHQRRVRRQPAQVGRANERCGVANRLLVDVVGRHGRRQQRVHVADAVGL